MGIISNLNLFDWGIILRFDFLILNEFIRTFLFYSNLSKTRNLFISVYLDFKLRRLDYILIGKA